MPTGRAKRNSTVGKLAPLVPLGIALLHGGFSGPSTPTAAVDRAHELAASASTAVTHHCDHISDAKGCHTTYAEGCTDSTKPNTYDAYLSSLKNLLPAPSEARPLATLTSLADFQHFDEKTIALDLGQQKQAPFATELADIGEGNIYELVGYVYYAIPGGIETCNCKLKNKEDKDFHVGVGFDPAIAKSIAEGQTQNRGSEVDPVVQQTSVVVEMTPYYRATFHSGWTLPKVQQLEGHQVKIVGQLIVDNEHNNADQNCAFSDHGEECWRGSAWELHPVVSVYVCKTAQSCTVDSTQWETF